MSKPAFLSFFEEKVVFRISRTFWHAFAWIALVGVLGSTALLGWAIIPPLKPSVEKAPYPPVAAVSWDEVQRQLQPTSVTKNPSKPASKPMAIASEQAPVDEARGEYNAALAKLKQLFPENKFQWKDGGYWEYPYGYSYWEYLQTSDGRRWVVTKGISSILNDKFAEVSANTFSEKQQLLTAYNSAVSLAPLSQRVNLLASSLRITTGSADKSASNILEMVKAVSQLPKGKVGAFEKLATFQENHPDANGLFEVLSNSLGRFHATARNSVFSLMLSQYESLFGGNLEREQEAITGFLPMLANISPNKQAKAWNAYSTLFVNKNLDREKQIQEIDANYESELARVDANYQQEQTNKDLQRRYALYALAGGIALIAFVALCLVLLSIQRYLKRISEQLTPSAVLSVPAAEKVYTQP